MSFLYFLEDLRTPWLDAFFSTVTHLGEETFFILLGLVFFWCVDKKQGYYLLSIGFIGTTLNQFLKLLFRIPRPWVLDKNFTAVKEAIPEATGYSFPSGHTQSSVGVFGGIARWNKNRILRTIAIAICILVPFSRMYLGVHTPLDVGVSVLLSLLLIFVLYPLIRKSYENINILRIVLIITACLSAGLLLFVSFYNFPADIDVKNLQSGLENAYKMFGCTIGILLAFEIDERFIKFDTNGSLLSQVIMLILGLIPLLLIKEGLKEPLNLLFGGNLIANAVRYFLIAVFAGAVWPLTFKFFQKIRVKSKN